MHYLRGADSRAWTTDVPTFERVRYDNPYRGIDLVFYGTNQQLEYDFVVAPHADAAAIALTFDGADTVELNAAGDLVVSAQGRTRTTNVRSRTRIAPAVARASRRHTPSAGQRLRRRRPRTGSPIPDRRRSHDGRAEP